MVNRKGSKYMTNKRLIRNRNVKEFIYSPTYNNDFHLYYGDNEPCIFKDSIGKYAKIYDDTKTYDQDGESDCRPTNKNKKKLKKCKEIDNRIENKNLSDNFISKSTAKFLTNEEKKKAELLKEEKKYFDQIRNRKWHKEYQINSIGVSNTSTKEV